MQLHWSCNCTFNKRTSRHLSGKQCECLLSQSVREIEQWNMHKVVKYHVRWVVVSSQSALWGVKHGSGHWHCRSSFLQRKATQRKQRTQKQLHKIKQEINSTKGQHQAQASRHHQLDVPYQNQTTLSCHNFRGEKAAVRQQYQHTADVKAALSRNIAIRLATIPCPKNW